MDFTKSKSMAFQKISQTSDSEDEPQDLSKTLYSLSHYVDDETELISQLFSALSFKKIKTMLPPVLRNSPVAEIQKLFVQELTGMSRTRILAAINGEEVNTSSSDSDLSDSEFDSSSNIENADVTGDFSLSGRQKTLSEDMSPKTEFGAHLGKDALENKAETSNLTTLDLIELEMRAKLIKTMLEKQPNEDQDEALEKVMKVKIKTEPMSPELLAGIIKKERISPETSPARSSTGTSSSSSSSSRSRERRRGKRHSSSSRSPSSGKKSQRKRKLRSRSSSFSSKASSKRTRSSSSSTSGDSEKQNSRDEEKGKKKLTRKEFEERMKKAKMNRSYRKRDDSDDNSLYEEEEEDDSKRRKYRRWKAKMQRKLDEKAALWQKEYFEGLKKETEVKKVENDVKQSDEPEEGEVLEKEDGEIESNEEAEINKEENETVEEPEEGACTSTDNENAAAKDDQEPELNDDKQEVDPSPISASENISSYSEKTSRRRTRKKRKSRRHERSEEGKYSESIQTDYKEESPSQPEEVEEPMEEIVDNTADENSITEANMTLPSKSERQSISFSLLKKSLNVVQGSDDYDGDDANVETEPQGSKYRHFTPNEDLEIIGEETDKSLNESEELDESPSKVEFSPKSSTEETKISPTELEEGESAGVKGPSAENSNDSNIDIIGCIDPKADNKDSDSFDEDLISGSSWSTRWLQSDKVKTVVSDSKIMSKVRKKIQRKIQAKGKTEKHIVYSAPPQPMPQPVEVARPTKPASVIGSIEEYEKIVGVQVTKRPAVVRKLPACLDSGDSEDSEEEALWSQILKK